MKESVKIEKAIVAKVRKHIKISKQTIGGFFELTAEDGILKRTNTADNSDWFREFLTKKGIEYRGNGSFTIVLGVSDPIRLGLEYAAYMSEKASMGHKK